MKALFITFLLLGAFSCTSEPGPQPEMVVQEPEPPRQEAPAAPIVEEGTNFDLTSITQEEFNSTKEEMQALIEEINQVIRAKDYNKWLSYLAEDFIGVINSQNYLIELSQTSEGLKSRNIVLKTPEDYFTHVVVPSRGNVRVDPRLDDIEFLSHNRVKAFTINARKQRLRLFEFVRIGNNWKIAWPSSPVTDETSGVS
ncbi:MAG: hypothetical protein LBB68_03680 [Treponema sp.]|nr:hypothetical protein [Treponema sp.]